jgi:murein hydrolase activator
MTPRRAPFLLAAAALLGAGGLAASGWAQARGEDARALAAARAEAEAAARRSEDYERQAAAATDAAARARAEAEALAARIEGAEADLTAAEARIALVAALQAEQRRRLAERQEPVVRLTAALQTMARRPPALALAQPGSLDQAVHVRALLAATLPEVRRRTAALEEERRRGEALRAQAERAARALADSRTRLADRRAELAAFAEERRARSGGLAELALAESDRALALGEEARALSRRIGTSEHAAALERRLSVLPPPVLRPGSEGETRPPRAARLRYLLPVNGRLLTGVGEISDAGVHARGLTFETEAGATVIAPAAGRVLFAGPFRGYGQVAILDHGGGWTTVLTDLAELDIATGADVARGGSIGRAARERPRISFELRREGRPVPVAQLIAG